KITKVKLIKILYLEKMATEVPDNFETKFQVALNPKSIKYPVSHIANIQNLQPGERFSRNFTPEEFERTIFIIIL
ncbi:9534_t:CDS:2, partial [Racocetra fulgida]